MIWRQVPRVDKNADKIQVTLLPFKTLCSFLLFRSFLIRLLFLDFTQINYSLLKSLLSA
jgi:hypothetical protein